VLAALAVPAVTESPNWRAYFEFSGVLHPAVSHFPIALLTVAGLIEAWSIVRRQKQPSQSTLVCLTIGTMAAVVTTVLGWADADRTGYSSGETINLHRWLGVAVAILSVIALVLSVLVRRRASAGRKLVWSYRSSVLASAALVGLVGSLGGKLVHGNDYYDEAFKELAFRTQPKVDLAKTVVAEGVEVAQNAAEGTAVVVDSAQAAAVQPVIAAVAGVVQTPAPAPAPESAAPPATQPAPAEAPPVVAAATQPAASDPAPPATSPAAPAAVPAAAQVTGSEFGGGRIDFARDIQPIFQSNCVKCHNDKKSKGDYRLDGLEHLFAAGETGAPPILPGKSGESLLVKVIEGKGGFEDSVMPPKGDRLSFQQIALIRQWIDEGAKPTAAP
jgi:uncharacterized membrane protein/mono/diheme cytochrome c family protein